MAKTTKLLILVEATNTRSQLVDILSYIATSDMAESDYMTVYTAVINKMRTF